MDLSVHPTRLVRAMQVHPHRLGPLSGMAFALWMGSALLSGVATAEELPRELAFGLPEVEVPSSSTAKAPFCPLGVCQPRSQDSIWAGLGFTLSAVACAWIGKRKNQNGQ